MKNNIIKVLTVSTALLAIVSCRKDRADEYYVENPPIVKPDLTIKIVTSVAGFVTDENNKPVYLADIKAGIKQTTTDEYGYFEINNVSLPEAAGLVSVSKTDFYTAYKTFIPETGKQSFVRIELIPKNITGSVDATAGGTVTAASGAKVTLPANAVVLAQGGSFYTGPVNVLLHWIDPTNINAQQKNRPGDSRGLNTEDHLVFLRSLGTLAVELTGNSGQRLQIADGKKATINLPIPSSLGTTAPSKISLWSLNETTGLWKQESEATRSGLSYSGEVSHFSFWDAAVDLPTVNLTVQIVDAQLHPLANTTVGIRYANQTFNNGGGSFGFTDANGIVHGAVPANSNLVLSVLTPCEIEAYSHSFNSQNSPIDLGTITGNIGQGLVTISGNAVDCNNQPVTDGYIQTFENGLYNRAPIVNGSFSFTGIACTNMSTNLVLVDNNANQQSAVHTVPLVNGNNPLGTLSACGTSTVGTITYSVDGTPYVLTEPAKSLRAYHTTTNDWTAILDIVQSGQPQINFQFNGGTAIGNAHQVTEIFSPSFTDGRATAPVPLTVNITEYGNPGGFISGEFSGLLLEFPSNTPRNFSCEFRVRRYN